MCSATLTLNFGNLETNLLFKQREKCYFFFLLLSGQPDRPQQRWFQVEESCFVFAWQWAQYVTGWEDIAPHTIYLSSSGKGFGMITPRALHSKVPCSLFAALFTRSKNSSAAAQGARNRAGPAVGARPTSKRHRVSLPGEEYLGIAWLWVCTFPSSLFQWQSHLQLCLLPASTGCSFSLQDLYQS